MISFRILQQSKKSRARAGIISTPHGDIETPTFVPVATQGAIKALAEDAVIRAGTQLMIANTFHLLFKPGVEVLSSAGGLHEFMHWHRPLMTDSGGFQVFSLGFGMDHSLGKIDKRVEGDERRTLIDVSTQPKQIKISEEGVRFRSPMDGSEVLMTPESSIATQQVIGADIIYAFDECTPPRATRAYIEESLARTHRWEERSLAALTSQQAMYGIVQGSEYRDLRERSARFVSERAFAGFGIGGDLGESKAQSAEILEWVIPTLDQSRPRHLLGIGHPEDIELMVRGGVDTFDCISPTQLARRGIAFTALGRIDLRKEAERTSTEPIDVTCPCDTCVKYSRAYLSHLLRAGEINAYSHITLHNLTYMHRTVRAYREQILSGEI